MLKKTYQWLLCFFICCQITMTFGCLAEENDNISPKLINPQLVKPYPPATILSPVDATPIKILQNTPIQYKENDLIYKVGKEVNFRSCNQPVIQKNTVKTLFFTIGTESCITSSSDCNREHTNYYIFPEKSAYFNQWADDLDEQVANRGWTTSCGNKGATMHTFANKEHYLTFEAPVAATCTARCPSQRFGEVYVEFWIECAINKTWEQSMPVLGKKDASKPITCYLRKMKTA